MKIKKADGITVQCKLLFPLLIASNLQCINILHCTESLICDLNNLPVVILRSKMAVAEGCDSRKRWAAESKHETGQIHGQTK